MRLTTEIQNKLIIQAVCESFSYFRVDRNWSVLHAFIRGAAVACSDYALSRLLFDMLSALTAARQCELGARL